MKQVTKYQANDNTLFDTADAATQRDVLMDRCTRIDRLLGEHPHSSYDRYTVNPVDLRYYRNELFRICRELFPNEAIFKLDPDEVSPWSVAGRIVNEAAPSCVNHLWWRLMCIHDGYIYEQPYYALHPEEWKPRKPKA